MGMVLRSFGGAGEVTGSKHLVTVDGGARILLDCGMFQGRRKETDVKNRELPFDPAKLDAVVLSHGHFDHSGNLPTLVKHGYEGNIHCTSASRDIANLVLMDSAHIMAKDYEWMLKKMPDKEAVPPVFDERDVLKVMDHFVTLGWHRRFLLPGGVEGELFNSGHILGSSLVKLTRKNAGGGTTGVLFTGDVGRPGMPIIPPPESFPDVDYLICESTYGNRKHDPIADARTQLAAVIRETAARGGKIIIPSFAIGRTQELIFFLHLLSDAKEIPELDIFVDSPMAVNATGIFRIHPECYGESIRKAFLDHHDNPFGFERLTYITDVEKSKKLNDRKDPCIIISGSGMCEGGRILHHLKNNIADPRNTVLVVGFMAQNTLGRAIADRRPSVKIFGDSYPLRAKVKILNTFSGHADYEDLTRFVGAMDLQRLRRAYLVHGESDALESMKTRLLERGVREVVVVAPGVDYPLE